MKPLGVFQIFFSSLLPEEVDQIKTSTLLVETAVPNSPRYSNPLEFNATFNSECIKPNRIKIKTDNQW